MAFLVLVMQRRGEVEIAQHIRRRRLRLLIMPVFIDVAHQPAQQRQTAAHAVVTRQQHLERLFEADGGGIEAGKGGGHGLLAGDQRISNSS